jgi:hypothetical protein
MHADLDLLLITVYCTADDLLPQRPRNARRKLTDAEIVTLSVAQVLMGLPSDRRFLRAARRQLGHLFPCLPSQDAFHKRRARLGETIVWLVGVFAAQSPGYHDSLLLLDSTPVECGRSLETTRRSELADACGYGYCRSHSRWFWGMRLHLACADCRDFAAEAGSAALLLREAPLEQPAVRIWAEPARPRRRLGLAGGMAAAAAVIVAAAAPSFLLGRTLGHQPEARTATGSASEPSRPTVDPALLALLRGQQNQGGRIIHV